MSNSNSRNRDLSNLFNKFNRNLLASSALVVGMGFAQYATAAGMPVPTLMPSANNTNIARQNYGNATIATTINANNTQTMQVTQSTNRAVIDWNSFDVDSGNNVNFTVPNNGATLNFIHDTYASLISGTVRSNGTLYLANPNGFVFKVGSDVSAKNLLVTTQSPDADGFYNSSNNVGKFSASLNSNRGGYIDLYGNIHADQGFLAIIAPQVFVATTGVVTANMGRVNLVGGEIVNIVDFSGTGLMNFELSDRLEQGLLSHPHAAMIENAGRVSGGTVQMDAKAAHNMLRFVTSNSASIVEHGTISANNLAMSVDGGNIDTTLDNNLVAGTIKLTTSHGGNIWTGGLSASNGNVMLSADGSIQTTNISASRGSVVFKAVNGSILSNNIVTFGVASLTAAQKISLLSANAGAISIKAGNEIKIGKYPKWQTTSDRLGENRENPYLDGTVVQNYALNALSGAIDVVSSAGYIIAYGDITARDTITISGYGIEHGGSSFAYGMTSMQGDINLTSKGGNIYQFGNINAEMGAVTLLNNTNNFWSNSIFVRNITAQSINASASGGLHSNGRGVNITATNGDIVINANVNIGSSSKLTANGNISINGTNSVNLYGDFVAGGNVSISANSSVNGNANITAEGDITINGYQSVSVGQLESKQGDITVTAYRNNNYWWYYYYGSLYTGNITALNGKVVLNSLNGGILQTGQIRSQNISLNLPNRSIVAGQYYTTKHNGENQFL